MAEAGWRRGDQVWWRSLPRGEVGYTFPATVAEATDEHIALFQHAGSTLKRRAGERGGPRGRQLVGPSSGHVDYVWPGPSTVRLWPRGRTYTVIRTWADDGHYRGWYVNFELPWVINTHGADTCDLVVDLTVADDLSSWELKDLDEAEWAVEHGIVPRPVFEAILDHVPAIASLVADQQWPFDPNARCWQTSCAPDATWPLPTLHPAWSAPPDRRD